MKKTITIVLAALMALTALTLTACGGSDDADYSDSKYVGTWIATDISLADESEAVDDDWILTVKEDGTGTLDDGKEVTEFTWAPTDDGFKTKGDMKLTFKDDGEDGITTKIIGANLNFKRQ